MPTLKHKHKVIQRLRIKYNIMVLLPLIPLMTLQFMLDRELLISNTINFMQLQQIGSLLVQDHMQDVYELLVD